MMRINLRFICRMILIVLLALTLTACGPGNDEGNGAGNGDESSDDHGNSLAFATFISLGNDVNGNIETSSDVDYFAFSATDGKTYTIETSSGTLNDTTIYLFDENSFQIDHDDDSGVGYASKITWTCNLPENIISGTYYVKVESHNNNSTGTYTLRVQEETSDGGEGGYNGWVLESGTHTPISGADVSAGGVSDTTDSDGAFDLQNIPA